MLNTGPLTLGTMRPYATATHIDGRVFQLPLEEYPTVASIISYLADSLAVAVAGQAPLSICSGESAGIALEPEVLVEVGQRFQTLVCLEVRVVLGHSDIGINGAKPRLWVVLSGYDLLQARASNIRINQSER
jgi:hypothetical protein